MFDCLPGRCLGVLLCALAASPTLAAGIGQGRLMPGMHAPKACHHQAPARPRSGHDAASLAAATSAGGQLSVPWGALTPQAAAAAAAAVSASSPNCIAASLA